MTYPELTLGPTAQTVFEIGGTTPGTQYDRINVTGALQLDGEISVRLIGDFRPTDGQIFNVLNYGSVGGAFASGTGLVDAGNGVFFEIIKDTGRLDLKAHVLDPTVTALVDALTSAVEADDAALQDRIGTWLNFDHFRDNASFSFNGAIELGEGLSLSGAATIGFVNDWTVDGRTVDVFTLGLENATGALGLAPGSTSGVGLNFSDIDLGVLWLRDQVTDGEAGWVWAEGQADGLSVAGGSGISLTASSLSLDFALGLGSLNGQSNDRLLNLSVSKPELAVGSTTYTFDSAETSERAALSGTVNSLLLGNLVTLSGTMGFASSAEGLRVAGSGITARMGAGGVSAGVDNGSFGLVLNDNGTYVLEASGGFHLSGGDFAGVSAEMAVLRLNTTGAAKTATTLQVGGYTHAISAMSALSDPVIRVTGLQARIGDRIGISGDFAFERDGVTGDLQVLASNASASLRAGDVRAGVSDADVALVISNRGQDSGVWLEASGSADMALDDAVQVSADSAAVRWNSTGVDATGRQIQVAGAGGRSAYGRGQRRQRHRGRVLPRQRRFRLRQRSHHGQACCRHRRDGGRRGTGRPLGGPVDAGGRRARCAYRRGGWARTGAGRCRLRHGADERAG
jgi:hypothetical protein